MVIEKEHAVHNMCGSGRKATGMVCGNHGIQGLKLNDIGVDKMGTRYE